jgi:hypothetical protein
VCAGVRETAEPFTLFLLVPGATTNNLHRRLFCAHFSLRRAEIIILALVDKSSCTLPTNRVKRSGANLDAVAPANSFDALRGRKKQQRVHQQQRNRAREKRERKSGTTLLNRQSAQRQMEKVETRLSARKG